MPIPKPSKGEKKGDFISRYMGDKKMMDEYDQKQRAGVCYSSWKQSLKANQSLIIGNLANYTVRYETIDNINYMVVPVTMMVSGVHSGSDGPALYTEDVLSDLPEQWNGRPVVVIHPDERGKLISANSPEVIQQQAVGNLFNTKYDGGLKSEAYINTEKLEGISKDSLAALSSGQIMEVSIGGYETRSNEEGEWNGEKYMAIVQSISSDHLALLPPGLEGACSISDGCGIRANAKRKEVLTIGEDNKGLLHSLIRGIRSFMVANENSDNDRRVMIDAALRGIVKGHPWVNEVYSDYFIYVVDTDEEYALYKRSYSINDNKAILGEEVVEVREEVEYVPVSNITGNNLPGVVPVITYEDMKGESSMNKEQIIDYLVTNGSVTGYSEDNRESLMGMTDCQLSKIHNIAEKLVGNSGSGTTATDPSKDPDPEPAPAKTTEPAAEPTGNSSVVPVAQLTTEQFMQIVPAEFKSAMTMVMNQSTNQKTALITNIMKSDPSFDKEELNGMSNNMLQKIANSLSVASFVGNGGGPVPELNDNSKYTEMTKLWDNLPN